MVTEEKRANVALLADLIRPAQCMIVTDYRGLNTPEMNALRNDLQGTAATYRVIKNRLMKVAAEQEGAGALAPLLEGPERRRLLPGRVRRRRPGAAGLHARQSEPRRPGRGCSAVSR